MTIPTRNPESKPTLTKKDAEIGSPTASHVAQSSENTSEPASRVNFALAYFEFRRRQRLLTSICALLLILWLLTSAIFGVILLFKYMRKDVYRGWCGVNYLDESKQKINLQQKVEVDEKNQYEKIEVPQLGANHPGSFVHDFRQNLTAIIDAADGRCFVKPLDRSQIAPPSNFIDFIRKAESGYYALDTPVIQENFRVKMPAISKDDLNRLGSLLIVHLCTNRDVYMLEKKEISSDTRAKRDAKVCETLSFVFYNANGAVIKENIEAC